MAIDGWPRNSRYPNVSLCSWATVMLSDIMSGPILHQGEGVSLSDTCVCEIAFLHSIHDYLLM